MRVTTSIYPTLVNSLLEGESQAIRSLTLILAGTMLLYLSAKLKIPLDPVPISMQTFKGIKRTKPGRQVFQILWC